MILDIEEKGMKIPKVEYELYKINQENNLIKLNLNLCKNNKIEISIPIEKMVILIFIIQALVIIMIFVKLQNQYMVLI